MDYLTEIASSHEEKPEDIGAKASSAGTAYVELSPREHEEAYNGKSEKQPPERDD